MRAIKYVTISILSLFISSIILKAQDPDFRIYTKAGVKFNIAEKLSNTSEFELRTKDNSSKLSVLRFNTSFGYKFNNYFSAGIGYAFISNLTPSSPIAYSNRYWLEAKGSISASNFSFSLRERFQQTFAQGQEVSLLRSELKVQYKIDNSIFKPYVSVEPHIFLFNELKGYKEIRYNLGTDIAINENNDLQVYGRYTQNHYQILTSNFFVLGISYYYKF